MTRMLVDGARYEVREGGRGPAILLIHGFTGRGANWAPFLRGLRRTNRAIVVDLLGHGDSDAPADPTRHALERQAADLAEILRRLDAVPAAVVGYSFGARVALQLALDHPAAVRMLFLASPSAGIVDARERARRRTAERELVRHIEADGLPAFIETWEAAPLFAPEGRLSPEVRARIHAGRLRNRPEGLIASLLGAGQGVMTPLHDRLGEIKVPTVILAGSADETGLARARVVNDAIPQARLIVLHGHGHAPHREAPILFRDLLIDQIATWSDT
jgi:2-succinyl-6-hydroxy-2,4-cyclohexadiene-1-carboxylate synthase